MVHHIESEIGPLGNPQRESGIPLGGITGTDDKTRYPRVGVLFENHNRETGEVYYTIKLDFPVGVTEMIAFPPRPRDESDASGAED